MTTYSSIIKNIIKTENNVFNYNYKDDGVNGIIKIFFNSYLNQEINIKTKYKFFMDTINIFCIKGTQKEEEFINFFCKIQKTYNLLNKFLYRYKYKKAKIVVNTDMCLNEIILNSKNVICIYQNDSKYLFHINDLIKIINTSLTNSYMFFSEPVSVKNPYNNLPFDKSTLYNIYFYVIFNTNYHPELLFKFFDVDFNLTIFKNKNEYLLREKIIYNFVYKSTSQILVDEIKSMIFDFNYREKINKIIIDVDFPKEILIKVFQPYLLLYVISQYGFLQYKKTEASIILKKTLKRFQKFNPQFGRKKYKLLMGHRKNFTKYVKKKLIEFDDRHIKFNDVDYQNEMFLTDHLKYEEINYEITRLRTFFAFNFIRNNGNEEESEEEENEKESEEEESEEEESEEEENDYEDELEEENDYEDELEEDSVS